MELKNVNPNSGNVVVSNPNNVKFFKIRIVEIEFKNKHHTCIVSLQDIMIAQKKKYSILYTSLINTKCLKASFIDMNLLCKKKQN
jgi:hypothetical protein